MCDNRLRTINHKELRTLKKLRIMKRLVKRKWHGSTVSNAKRKAKKHLRA